VVEEARVHGEVLDPFLGFYPVQIRALKALWGAIHNCADIEYEVPLNQFNTTSKGYEQDVKYGKFNGFISHYHVSKKKIDCAGLDIKYLLEEIMDEENVGYIDTGETCEDR
jgi:hypothetical protein